MRKTLLRGLAAAGAVLAVTLGMASAASADPVSVVTIAGDSTNNSYPIVGVNTAPIAFSAGVNMSCDEVDVYGDAYSGTSHLNTIADLTSSDWRDCVGPLGICMTVDQTSTWQVVADPNGFDPSTGVTDGSITGVNAHVEDCSGGALCSFDVAGDVDGNFANATQELDVTGPSSLVVSNVSGCFGLVPNGTPASFTGDFDVQSVPTGPVRPTPGPHYPIIIS